ncbi:hypothetical protein BsWGS_05691 [Bradybaena similaris]
MTVSAGHSGVAMVQCSKTSFFFFNLEAAEMCFYRRLMRIMWKNKKRNEDVFGNTNSPRELVTRIMRRKSAFFGHVMRRGKPYMSCQQDGWREREAGEDQEGQC